MEHGKPWRGRIWCQSQHKTPWITFRGHSRSRSLGSLKSRRRAAYYCIITWALESEISKERSEHLRFREPHCHSASHVYEIRANIRTNLIFLETRIIDLRFAADNMGLYLHLNFSKWLHKTIFSLECVSAAQGHPRSLLLVLIESAYATSY